VEGERLRNFIYGGQSRLTGALDFHWRAGWLGHYSAINPLTTACKYALRVAEIVTSTLYQDVKVTAPRYWQN